MPKAKLTACAAAVSPELSPLVLVGLNDLLLEILGVPNVVYASMVGCVRLHGEHDTDDHVASATGALHIHVFEQLPGSGQVKERLVAELHLAARLTDVQNFGHLVEPHEELVSLSVSGLEVAEQVNLELDAVELFAFVAGALCLLCQSLLALDVLHVEANASAQLKEWLGHVLGDVVDDQAADDHVHRRGCNQVGHPETEDRHNQMALHLVDARNTLVVAEDEELEGCRGKVCQAVEDQVAEDEEDDLRLRLLIRVNHDAVLLFLVKLGVVELVHLLRHFERAKIDLNVAVKLGIVAVTERETLDLAAQDVLAEVPEGQVVVGLEDCGAVEKHRSKDIFSLGCIEVVLENSHVHAHGCVEITCARVMHVRANSRHQLFRKCVRIQVEHNCLVRMLQTFPVPRSALHVVVARLVLAETLELWLCSIERSNKLRRIAAKAP